MARALKLIFRCQPAWGAAEVSTFRKQSIEAGFFSHDPDAILLLELFIDLPKEIVVWLAGLKSCRRQKKNPRKCRANKSDKRKKPKYTESAPAQTGKKSLRDQMPLFSFSLPPFIGNLVEDICSSASAMPFASKTSRKQLFESRAVETDNDLTVNDNHRRSHGTQLFKFLHS